MSENQAGVLICDNGNIVNKQERVSNPVIDYCNNTMADVGPDTGYNNVNMSEEHDFDTCLANVLQKYESHPRIVNIRVEIL